MNTLGLPRRPIHCDLEHAPSALWASVSPSVYVQADEPQAPIQAMRQPLPASLQHRASRGPPTRGGPCICPSPHNYKLHRVGTPMPRPLPAPSPPQLSVPTLLTRKAGPEGKFCAVEWRSLEARGGRPQRPTCSEPRGRGGRTLTGPGPLTGSVIKRTQVLVMSKQGAPWGQV